MTWVHHSPPLNLSVWVIPMPGPFPHHRFLFQIECFLHPILFDVDWIYQLLLYWLACCFCWSAHFLSHHWSPITHSSSDDRYSKSRWAVQGCFAYGGVHGRQTFWTGVSTLQKDDTFSCYSFASIHLDVSF